jgi:hypothetical protein
VEDLQGDGHSFEIPGEKDASCPAPRELALDCIAVAQGLLDHWQQLTPHPRSRGLDEE